MEQSLRGSQVSYVTRTLLGIGRLYLGDSVGGLEALIDVVKVQPAERSTAGMPEANLFAAHALIGESERARTLAPSVQGWLPVLGRRNMEGAYLALEGWVCGLALLGDREACGQLYALSLEDIKTGLLLNVTSVGPINPQLGAALTADAAGLPDRAREHFEIAMTQARDIPIRLLQPTVLYWYGRFITSQPARDYQLRGQGMVQAALEDFRALEMVLHANLAERFLREGSG